ncbi:FMN-binding negative transcriptional regulator [Zunongwangia sp. F363]|uniref:FMN-binding negative transcriptional regulator n=1 Tax=Autumnicola tepida TaxID=3075595 RepID=A0ABU3C4L4_9FLAO|nr:FMN-binding negative transcriptional regulator [Zunongwangia sp. F363]MDT0641265.1 FMN-binding negative transcriptional regulator [Zunongwangia sp. F363]
MYQRAKYKKTDENYIFNFIRSHPFATLVLQGDRLLATHIPVLTKGNADKFILYGHIAYNNEQYQYLKDGLEALLIFQGAHDYISSSWYKEKNISTWDYSAVHINVKLKLQSRKELEESLEELVRHFENEQDNPLYYKDIPDDMLKEHLPLITGFWCEPVKTEAIAKLHQGFEKEDLESVTQHLQAKDSPGSKQLKQDIEKENPHLF